MTRPVTRIDDTFARLRAANRKAFVAYVMAGDPDYDTSLRIVLGLPAAGVDIIELGLPFTDPMADGPTIQLAEEGSIVVPYGPTSWSPGFGMLRDRFGTHWMLSTTPGSEPSTDSAEEAEAHPT